MASGKFIYSRDKRPLIDQNGRKRIDQGMKDEISQSYHQQKQKSKFKGPYLQNGKNY